MSDLQEKIRNAIAPCSLCCYTCPAKRNGMIAQTAGTLLHYLEGYPDFRRAVIPEKNRTSDGKIAEFLERLEKYSRPTCDGCRVGTHGSCCISGCLIRECTQAHHVDFCAECEEFPCGKLTEEVFHPTVIQEWKDGNERIRVVGIEQYFKEITAQSHYLPFQKK